VISNDENGNGVGVSNFWFAFMLIELEAINLDDFELSWKVRSLGAKK
jgi:hypothetical protein